MFENYMKYKNEFCDKRAKVLKKLLAEGMSEKQIVDCFQYSSISKKEPDFCILFGCGEVCHSLPREKLNCFGCYCPYFEMEVWNDGERDIIGRCAICSEYMTIFTTPMGEHLLDCTNCWFPHSEEEVLKNLRSVKKMMRKV
jgi:Zn-finger protein